LRGAILSVKGLTLVGPVTLPQGRDAAVGQLPVFLEDSGKPKFWGFVAVTLKFPDVLISTRINSLPSQGYAYELWRVKPEDGRKQRIMASGVQVENRALQQTIELPYATWNLSIARIDSRVGEVGFWLKIVIGLLISGLSGFLAKLLIDSLRYKRQLELLAFTDTVTGLPNRRLLLDRLGRDLAQIQRNGGCLALAFIDLDGFKAINDKYGHEVGDQVLQAAAVRMKQVLRETDTLARMGGDEFVVVMQGLDEQASNSLTNRLLAAILSPAQIGDLMLQVSGSVGLVFHQGHEKADADELLRRADLAMYQAKIAGKNRYQVFRTPAHI
jgi:diguanylate cyclase (GGDEF)-like protein